MKGTRYRSPYRGAATISLKDLLSTLTDFHLRKPLYFVLTNIIRIGNTAVYRP